MRIMLAAAVMLSAIGISGTAQAQTALEARVDRLEREMRAVQRKVFPGGGGATVEPQITPEQANGDIPGVPAGSPMADLTARVAALETQVATLTNQVELAQNRVRQLEDSFGAYKRSTDARIKALEETVSAVPGRGGETPAAAADNPVIDQPPATRPSTRPARPAADPKPAAGTAPPETDTAKPAATGTGSRAERLAAIPKPTGTDPAENGYAYGFRLWQAKLYPEARKELEEVATKYPTHRRASWAMNLLGRAYLDAGAPSLAAKTFFDNYTKNPKGERAPDSLYYLAQALEKLNKPSTEICRVYTELNKSYGDTISAEMKAGVAAGRAKHKCK